MTKVCQAVEGRPRRAGPLGSFGGFGQWGKFGIAGGQESDGSVGGPLAAPWAVQNKLGGWHPCAFAHPNLHGVVCGVTEESSYTGDQCWGALEDLRQLGTEHEQCFKPLCLVAHAFRVWGALRGNKLPALCILPDTLAALPCHVPASLVIAKPKALAHRWRPLGWAWTEGPGAEALDDQLTDEVQTLPAL